MLYSYNSLRLWLSWIEHQTTNLGVGRSNRSRRTNKNEGLDLIV